MKSINNTESQIKFLEEAITFFATCEGEQYKHYRITCALDIADLLLPFFLAVYTGRNDFSQLVECLKNITENGEESIPYLKAMRNGFANGIVHEAYQASLYASHHNTTNKHKVIKASFAATTILGIVDAVAHDLFEVKLGSSDTESPPYYILASNALNILQQ